MKYSFLFLLVFTLFSCTEEPAKEERGVAEQSADSEKQSAEVKTIETPPVEDEITEQMFADFLVFRKAMLSGSCENLATLCEFPLGGDCASDVLGLTKDISARNVTNKEFLNNCHFLDETELAVLKKRTSLTANTDVSNGECGYKDFLNVSEGGKEFSWSVGCIQLVEKEIGEYTRIFVFRKTNDHFKLYKVDCAG